MAGYAVRIYVALTLIFLDLVQLVVAATCTDCHF